MKALLFLASLTCFAQTPPAQLQMQTPAPQSAVAFANVVGNTGPQTYFYYVISRFPVGATISQPVQVTGVPLNLSVSNYVTVGWSRLQAATGYDVIRLNQPDFNGSSCTACAVVVNTSTPETSDTGSALSDYSAPSAAASASGTLYVNNRDYSAPELRQIVNGVDNPVGTGSGNVASVSATSPIVSSGGNNPVISCPSCGSSSPSGPAGGDLSGTYPNPVVMRIAGGLVTTYPSGISDPASAPTVSQVGTTDATAYGYKIELILGTAGDGVTAPGVGQSLYSFTGLSPEGTVTGNSTLSVSNYNVIALPNETDANIGCEVIRTTGPQTPQVIFQGQCGPSGGTDGMGNVLDQAVGSETQNIVIGGNSTVGTVLWTPTNGFPLVWGGPGNDSSQVGASQLIVPSAIGGSAAVFGVCTDGVPFPAGWVATAYLGSCTTGPWWDGSFAGNAWIVTSISHSDSPYTITRATGFLRVDTSAGNVVVNLPDPTSDSNFPIGRMFWVKHATSDTNTITVTPPSPYLIDGQSTFVLSCAYGSVGVYAEGSGGAGGNWPTMAESCPTAFTGTQIVPTGCTVTGGTPTGCTSTTNTYIRGKLISHTP